MKPEEATGILSSADGEVNSTSGKSGQVKRRGTKRSGRPLKQRRGRPRRAAIENGSANVSVSEEDEYVVEDIVSHRSAPDGSIEFFVKWENWSHDSNTWEPFEHLKNSLETVVNYFEKELNEKVQWGTQVIAFKDKYLTVTDKEIEKVALNYIMPDRDAFPTVDLVKLEERINLVARLPRAVRDRTLIDELKHEMLVHKAYEKRKLQLKTLSDWASEINEISFDKAPIHVDNQVDLDGRPVDFKYINSSKQNLSEKISDDPPIGCECSPVCTKSNCSCANNGCGKITYRNGTIRVPKGTPIYECNSKCRCGPDCENRVLQYGRKVPLGIFKTSNGRGWGVKTLKSINKGEFVTEYVGEIITREKADDRGKIYDREGRTYLFDLDFNDRENFPYTIDAAEYGNVSHFINHSCSPNLEVFAVWVQCLDPNLPRLGLFARKNINPNEELTFDYLCKPVSKNDKRGNNNIDKTSNTTTIDKKVFCKCNAPNCRTYLF